MKANEQQTTISAKEYQQNLRAAKANTLGFKASCNAFIEIAESDTELAKIAKKICAYLQLTTDSLAKKNIKDTRKRILDAMPLYYTIDGTETHFPARLAKLPKESGIDAYIARADTYLHALITLAKLLEKGNTYETRQVFFCEYDADHVATTLNTYDKIGKKIETDIEKYNAYLRKKQTATNESRNTYNAIMNK